MTKKSRNKLGRNREPGKATEGKESDIIGRKKNGKERQRGKYIKLNLENIYE